MAVLPDGQRLWGSHPDGTRWVTKNVKGSPLTIWCFNGNQVVQAPPDVRAALAQDQ